MKLYCNAKLSLYYWTHCTVVIDEFITSKNTDFTLFFTIKPRHTDRLKNRSRWKNPQWEPYWSHASQRLLPQLDVSVATLVSLKYTSWAWKKTRINQTEAEINTHKKQNIIMKICKLGSHSAKSVTIIDTDTTFSSIIFIAQLTSANKTSHSHCFWNLNHNMLQNIVSFPYSPDIQNCIYQFYTHSVSQF